MKSRLLLTVLSTLIFSLSVRSQGNISINHFGIPPHPTAILDISSFDQGILIPRMEDWVKWSIFDPPEGLIVCDTTTKSLWMYASGIWEELAMKYNTHFTNDLGTIHNVGDIDNDDFVFGSTSLNENGIPGQRRRFFFDKGKAAFRAGELFDVGSTPLEDESKRWDLDSLGIGSVALGVNAMAKNTYSVAIGGNAVARGHGSIAIGNTVEANGSAAVAIGITKAIGDRSFSSGSTNQAIGYGSSAMGELTLSKGKLSTTMGNYTVSDAYANVAIGRFNVGGGDSSNWVSSDPIFEIGNAPDLSSRQNAFTVLKGGTMIAGSHQVDDDPSRINDNHRMFYHKVKGAFRSGGAVDDPITGLDENLSFDKLELGFYSSAFGLNPQAPGYGSFASGLGSAASDTGTTALGASLANGKYATAAGYSSFATGNYSSALGCYARANSYAGVAVGFNNVGGGNPTAFVATDPIFEVGNGDWVTSSNAFTVLKNANVGINTSFPQAKLQIEQSGSGPGSGILMHNSGYGHWETNVGNNSDYNYYFNNNLRAHLTEQGTFHLPEGLDVGLLTDGNLVIGPTSGWNISIDNNEIMARNAGGAHDLLLQKDGGRVGIGTSPLSLLDVGGNLAVGSNYAGALTAPPNGAIFEGYVGIGTHYPYNRLDVKGNIAIGSNYAGTAAYAPTNGAIIEGKVGIGTDVVQNTLDVEGSVAIGSAYSGTAPGPVNGLAVEGNVGIGTLGPANKLDVSGKITLSQSLNDEMVIINGNTYAHKDGFQTFGTGGDYFIMGSKEGSNETAGIYGDGDLITIWSAGDGGKLLRILDEDHFELSDTDPYNNNGEKAYIDSDGFYFQVSDARLKNNINRVENAIDKISRINGYTYKFIRNQKELAKGQNSSISAGVLAQEVEKVLPEAVSKNESGQYFVNYDALIPVLIEGMKEQQEMIEKLQQKIKRLEERH